ncbi:acetoacetyl-CoA reductase [Hyphomonas pacifica]|uniref:Acetoacetyl-CoA reductase n=1 Tax=Hyphomonas pacifica TaxID=1280941 RepID=A0A062TXP8_9PROT|nr:acetoacetyl-CoA reductase [Hyphomonas pacifica]KCZ50807.1 acetoacetyl-CoA reductase [Hyphomonas pacifica]RAN33320.1 acetoacetyl-CoA reductase [Hyphomonas pacifica]RAN36979.1 acetoacetyl-CoA reductase [Hyphomonas pacifica]
MTRTVLVTGGTRGIGRAISEMMKHKGYQVAANYAGNQEAAEACAKELGIKCYKFDVADYDAVTDGLAAIEKDLGPVDILINNAGVTRDAPFHKMSREQWQQVIEIDLTSAFNCTRQVWEGMRDRGFGRVINISSINGQKGQFGQANYSAAKAGLIGMTKALAQEGAKKGITVNVVAPGYIDTEMVQAVPEKVLEGIISTIPVGRLGKAEEIASMCAYLASDEAAFITGATMTVNGAQYIAG